MIDLIVYLAVFAIVAVLIWWILQQLPLPEPVGKIVMIVFVVVAVVVLITLLLRLTGHSGGISLPG